MSNYITSLPVSQRFRDLGVKEESEKCHYINAGIPTGALVDTAMYKDASEDFKKYKLLPAYSLAELADVLREVGRIKRWRTTQGYCEWVWIKLCSKFFNQGSQAADAYLMSIL